MKMMRNPKVITITRKSRKNRNSPDPEVQVVPVGVHKLPLLVAQYHPQVVQGKNKKMKMMTLDKVQKMILDKVQKMILDKVQVVRQARTRKRN